ncbi:hypothetical protein LUPAC06_05677 [Micromonospora saelicesensis]|nr:hypothetical protein LUPAC06_05677 [Micromonospora saelicesensis]
MHCLDVVVGGPEVTEAGGRRDGEGARAPHPANPGSAGPAADPVAHPARDLVARLALRPGAPLPPSVYETGRPVARTALLPAPPHRTVVLLPAQPPAAAWATPPA